MRKLILCVLGSTALVGASAANAALTIGTSGTTAGSTFIVGTPDNTTIPNKVTFDTLSDVAGTYTSFFDFTENMNSTGNFALTTSTLGATITLAQLMSGGGATTLQTATGTGPFLNLTTGLLAANTTYRFSYTSNLPTGGGDISGNASFYAAGVPEPATWALMLLGFGGIGFAMRRRRTPVLAQVA